jgi:hypothetical protein
LCKVTKINTQREKLEGNTTGWQNYEGKLGYCMKFHQRNWIYTWQCFLSTRRKNSNCSVIMNQIQ